MKKFLPLLLTVFFIICLSVSPFTAYADNVNDAKLWIEVPKGADLGDFDVKLSYKNYTLYSSGAYRAFEISFDRYFVADNLTVVDDGETVDGYFLTPLAELIADMGYAVTVDRTNYNIIGEASFDTLTDLYIALGADGYDSNKTNNVTQSSFFYKDTFIKQPSPFTGIEESDEKIKDIIDGFYALGIKREGILLNYTYGTPYTIISSDADTTTYSPSENIYLHSFDMTMDMSDKKFTIKQHSPNPIGWYSMAVGIAIVVISVPFTIAIIKCKKKKRE